MSWALAAFSLHIATSMQTLNASAAFCCRPRVVGPRATSCFAGPFRSCEGAVALFEPNLDASLAAGLFARRALRECLEE